VPSQGWCDPQSAGHLAGPIGNRRIYQGRKQQQNSPHPAKRGLSQGQTDVRFHAAPRLTRSPPRVSGSSRRYRARAPFRAQYPLDVRLIIPRMWPPIYGGWCPRPRAGAYPAYPRTVGRRGLNQESGLAGHCVTGALPAVRPGNDALARRLPHLSVYRGGRGRRGLVARGGRSLRERGGSRTDYRAPCSVLGTLTFPSSYSSPDFQIAQAMKRIVRAMSLMAFLPSQPAARRAS